MKKILPYCDQKLENELKLEKLVCMMLDTYAHTPNYIMQLPVIYQHDC